MRKCFWSSGCSAIELILPIALFIVFVFLLPQCSDSTQGLVGQMNADADNFIARHHLMAGAPLPPEVLLADGGILFWNSSNGHTMEFPGRNYVIFTRGIVPSKGQPYSEIRPLYPVKPTPDSPPPHEMIKTNRVQKIP